MPAARPGQRRCSPCRPPWRRPTPASTRPSAASWLAPTSCSWTGGGVAVGSSLAPDGRTWSPASCSTCRTGWPREPGYPPRRLRDRVLDGSAVRAERAGRGAGPAGADPAQPGAAYGLTKGNIFHATCRPRPAVPHAPPCRARRATPPRPRPPAACAPQHPAWRSPGAPRYDAAHRVLGRLRRQLRRQATHEGRRWSRCDVIAAHRQPWRQRPRRWSTSTSSAWRAGGWSRAVAGSGMSGNQVGDDPDAAARPLPRSSWPCAATPCSRLRGQS